MYVLCMYSNTERELRTSTASTVEFETTDFYRWYELNVHRGGKQRGPISLI